MIQPVQIDYGFNEFAAAVIHVATEYLLFTMGFYK